MDTRAQFDRNAANLRKRAGYARALRIAMAAADVSGAELGRRLGMTPAAGTEWVRRRTRGQVASTTDDLERIATALGCRVRDLLPDR